MALSNKQLNFIEILVCNPMKSFYKLGAEQGIANSTLARWRKSPEFMAALEQRIKENFSDAARAAMENVTRLCQEGDWKASEFILKNWGYNPTQKLEADVNTTTIEVSLED